LDLFTADGGKAQSGTKVSQDLSEERREVGLREDLGQRPKLTTMRQRNPKRPAQLVIRRSLQIDVFSLGLLEDGDVGVGVLPESEEILIYCG
jgi:hypothetical protein